MITRQLIERIEGEATVDFAFKEGRVDFATIAFPHMRGMEQILSSKPAMDALVYTPRVCGICGHSHLMATVQALEDAYRNAGEPLTLSPKAQKIRELTLTLELVQNHFKWVYLVIYPELAKLCATPLAGGLALKGAFAAATANKALALFSGQWPHSSYAIPGGVTCDPTQLDLIRAEGFIDELIRFFEREFAGTSLEHFLLLKSCKEFDAFSGDMSRIERMLMEMQMQEKGFGYDRFMVLGEHGYAKPGKIVGTASRKADASLVELSEPYAPGGTTYALNARYRGSSYETGPLARAMSMGYPLIKNMHRRFKDSAYTRVNARMYETAQLLYRVKALLREIDISEPSHLPPRLSLQELSAKGEAVVEAPRGPLIHRVAIDAGKIAHYRMITPTQWNLGSGPREDMGVAQSAMRGSCSIEEATFIFRSFDVCSVCTTH